jgi:Na+-transporting NADH:ubiquinone oxidoreductase subunit A
MSTEIKIKKGLDIKLEGAADKVLNTVSSETYVVKPTDFHGVTPKLTVKVGDEVLAGQTIFFDKYNESVKFASPVSGEVVEIVRGAKRKLLEIKILADKEIRYATPEINEGSREALVDTMCKNGLWPMIKQRPYDVVANPSDTPKSIFVSGFDTAPLAGDIDFILHGREKDFQKGLDILAQLTPGKVNVNVHATMTTSSALKNASGVAINTFSGKHPAGLAGVQINHLDPINKGERVWVVGAQEVALIGAFFNKKKYDVTKVVAATGYQLDKPKYYRIISGAQITNIVKDAGLKDGDNRFISGNVLTGSQVGAEGHVNFYDNSITVITEGHHMQMFGWLIPNTKKFSMSRTFLSFLMPGKEYQLDTNTNGEERAFVMTGQYEQVFPMDVMPQYLVKSIMYKDIEEMDNLGIYEVAPEDFALCEFVCTSKIEVQRIVREGLDLAMAELG